MELISTSGLESAGLQVPGNTLVRKALFSYLKIYKMNNLCDEGMLTGTGINFIEELFQRLNFHFEIPDGELKHIPLEGPYIVMANHPFGFLDGLVMLDIMAQINPEFKVLANFFLKQFGPISDFFIELNPFASNNSRNMRGMKEAFMHLRKGHPLGIFPAGEVATMQKGFGKIEDKVWDQGAIKFMVHANVPIVPMYFYGSNSLTFHLLGKIHPYLRTLTIPSEMFKKENKTIQLRIGKPILPSELKDFNNNERAGRYLRTCLYALGSKVDARKFFRVNLHKIKQPETIIHPVPQEDMKRELERLKMNDGLLFTKSNFEIYLGKPEQIPNILRELGRLREVTFRQVGEGTNKRMDVDEYDLYYLHLFVWDSKSNQIVGAYRLGQGDKIIEHYSKRGFYVTSLFDLDDQMLPILQQTLEMGRSFVVKAYQQKPLPLFLLWQGILAFLAKNNHYQYLMGPVSISNDFTRFSKDVLIAFIKKHYYNADLAQMVYPRKEFKVKTNMDDIDVVLERHANDLQKLDRFISGIEPGYLKIPVLLKQYIKQNAKIIGFNVDPKFNNCLDGLMIANIKEMPEGTLNCRNRK